MGIFAIGSPPGTGIFKMVSAKNINKEVQHGGLLWKHINKKSDCV